MSGINILFSPHSSWAKQIPGFTELPLCDQMKMLQVSWAEVLTLQVAYRSSLPFTGKIYFATDFWLDERSAKECGALELYNHVSWAIQLGYRFIGRRG